MTEEYKPREDVLEWIREGCTRNNDLDLLKRIEDGTPEGIKDYKFYEKKFDEYQAMRRASRKRF